MKGGRRRHPEAGTQILPEGREEIEAQEDEKAAALPIQPASGGITPKSSMHLIWRSWRRYTELHF